MTFQYNLFGIPAVSDLELPEALGSDPTEGTETRASVAIKLGALPDTLPEGRRLADYMQASTTACLYSFQGVGSFLVERGRKIIIDPAPDAETNDVRAYLFGSVIGTLLHQRGLVPLHISAVVGPGGCIAFTGPSGAGKSTTAGAVSFATGWPILCDDMAVARLVDDKVVLSTGTTRLKLWKDAIKTFDIDETKLQRDLVREDKFHWTAPDLFVRDKVQLERLVVLDWADRTETIRVTGHQALVSVLNAVYRPYLTDLFGNRSQLTRQCADIAQRLKVFRLDRATRLDQMDKSLKEVCHEVTKLNEGSLD